MNNLFIRRSIRKHSLWVEFIFDFSGEKNDLSYCSTLVYKKENIEYWIFQILV